MSTAAAVIHRLPEKVKQAFCGLWVGCHTIFPSAKRGARATTDERCEPYPRIAGGARVNHLHRVLAPTGEQCRFSHRIKTPDQQISTPSPAGRPAETGAGTGLCFDSQSVVTDRLPPCGPPIGPAGRRSTWFNGGVLVLEASLFSGVCFAG
jgi:hypothetical protein